MVTGSGQLGAFWRRELEGQFERFHDRLTFVWSDDLSLAEILRRVRASRPTRRSSISPSAPTRRAGRMRTSECIADLRATANAPLFGVQSVLVGRGIVGGTLMSLDDLSRRNVADAAVRLLNGAPPASVTVPAQRPGPPIFDWRELQRWDIPESRLPAGQRRALSRAEPVAAHTGARC